MKVDAGNAFSREADDRDPRSVRIVRQRAMDHVCGAGGRYETAMEVVNGVKLPVFVQRHRSVVDLLDEAVARFADRAFMSLNGHTCSYAAAAEASESIARTLAERQGVRPGDRVAIFAANSPDWFLTFWATMRLGAIACAFNGWWTGEEARYAIDLVDPVVLLADAGRAARLTDGPLEVPLLDVARDAAAKGTSSDQARPSNVSVDEDAAALLLFTSGTTSKPKSALISHRGVVGFVQTHLCNAAIGARVVADASDGPESPTSPSIAQSTLLLTSPLFHVSGLLGGMMMAAVAGTHVVMRSGRFDPADVLHLIETHGVTNWSPLGATGARVLRDPSFSPERVHTVRQIGFGGGPTTPARRLEILHAFPNASLSVSNGYGSTETVATATSISGSEYDRNPRAAGRALPTVEVEIWDDEDRMLEDDQLGRVMVRSAYRFLGYWNSPEASAAVLRRDGFLDRGDFGRLVDGLLTIDSRARDMIIRSGENVSPLEVEAVLESHPAVAEAAVVAVDHDEHGQEVAAVVVPKAELEVVELEAFCAARLAAYKVPARWVLRAEPLPRNAAGKVVKRELEG